MAGPAHGGWHKEQIFRDIFVMSMNNVWLNSPDQQVRFDYWPRIPGFTFSVDKMQPNVRG